MSIGPCSLKLLGGRTINVVPDQHQPPTELGFEAVTRCMDNLPSSCDIQATLSVCRPAVDSNSDGPPRLPGLPFTYDCGSHAWRPADDAIDGRSLERGWVKIPNKGYCTKFQRHIVYVPSPTTDQAEGRVYVFLVDTTPSRYLRDKMYPIKATTT